MTNIESMARLGWFICECPSEIVDELQERLRKMGESFLGLPNRRSQREKIVAVANLVFQELCQRECVCLDADYQFFVTKEEPVQVRLFKKDRNGCSVP